MQIGLSGPYIQGDPTPVGPCSHHQGPSAFDPRSGPKQNWKLADIVDLSSLFRASGPSVYLRCFSSVLRFYLSRTCPSTGRQGPMP